MTRRRSGGFTLIELMMVVAIIGLLATVAVPAFQRYLRKSRTVEGLYGVSKIIEAARVFIDTKSSTPCDPTQSSCGGGLSWGMCEAPAMPFAQACQNHGGVFPESTIKDFSQPGQFFDQVQFAPEGAYRFKYNLYSLLWRLPPYEYGGFLAAARSDPGCTGKFIFVHAALIPTKATFTYVTPTYAYGFGPSGSDWSVRGPVVQDHCQETSCP